MPEYAALKSVYDQQLRRWAMSQAALHNMIPSDAAWTADDFMIPGAREARVKQAKADHMWVLRENNRLSRMKQGGKLPDNIPDWAKPTPRKVATNGK